MGRGNIVTNELVVLAHEIDEIVEAAEALPLEDKKRFEGAAARFFVSRSFCASYGLDYVRMPWEHCLIVEMHTYTLLYSDEHLSLKDYLKKRRMGAAAGCVLRTAGLQERTRHT